ncbi:MAG: ABC transporter ATP-binding protein, partial [Halanaerobium sp.]
MKLKTTNLSLSLGGKKIIEDINTAVAKGEFVGIIGPNGSGKSTLLKNIYRVLKADRGLIYLDGKNLAAQSLKESAKKMAVVKQFNNFNFDFTVEEIVMMGRSPHKKMLEFENSDDFQLIYESLKKVSMLEYAGRSFSTLSGGEKQRVSLARAFAPNPDLIIADEPVSSLDVSVQASILNLFNELQTKNEIANLFISHDLAVVGYLADIVAVIYLGELMEIAPVNEIFEPPHHPYTA